MCRNFEKVAPKLGQSHCTVQGHTGQILPKMKRREFFVFVIFPDTYTCFYIV